MKKIIYILLLLFLTIIEFYMLFQVAYYLNMSIKMFWIYHLLLGGIFYLLNSLFLKKDITYFDVLIVFFPGFGFCGLFLLEIIPNKKSDYLEIEDSIDLKSFIKDRKELEYINISTELGTLGAYDSILTGTLKEKKNFLMGFNPPKMSFKVEVLKKALEDDDLDVIHYAAAEINNIDENFQKKIELMKKEEDLSGLFEAYKGYMGSHLLEGEILQFYQEKSIELLKLLPEEDFILDKLKLLEESKKINECQNLLEKELSKNPTGDIVEFAKEFYHKRNLYREVKKLDEHFPARERALNETVEY